MEQRLYDLADLEIATDGDKEFMNNMIQLILTDVPKDIEAMKTALENKDYSNVSSIAHKIKPSIKYVCVNQLLDDVLAIETWSSPNEIMLKHANLFITNVYLVLAQLKSI